MRKAAGQRRLEFQAIIIERRIVSAGQTVQPEMLKARRPMVLPCGSKAVEIAVSDPIPIVELDAELECRPGRPHEARFFDPKQVVERHDRRDCAFTHTHRAPPTAFHPVVPLYPALLSDGTRL